MPLSALMGALRGAGRQHLTASTVAARQAVTGSHVFRIHGYTQLRKTTPSGTAVTSTAFGVGGQDWQIKCYPNGNRKGSNGQYTSLYLGKLGGSATATYDLSVLDRAGRPLCTRNSRLQLFEPSSFFGPSNYWGWDEFVKNDELEEGKHLVDDCLTVLCDVTIGDLLPLHAKEVEVHQRGRLPETMWNKETADVTVHAGGEAFAVHRWVLEARSPVFKAELEKTTDAAGELRVDGVDAETFQALLYFMYTDTLPPSDAPMAERLLVAADRFGLKLACEEKLCTRVNMASVAAMRAGAVGTARCAVLKEA